MYIDAMHRLQFYIRDSQLKQLKDLSQNSGQKMAEIIRRAVDSYLSARDDSAMLDFETRKAIKDLNEGTTTISEVSERLNLLRASTQYLHKDGLK